MNLEVKRNEFTDISTIGDFYINNEKICYVLEDCDREIEGLDVSKWKIDKKTCIPRGTYRVTVDWSNRFGQFMIHILDVPGFTGIRIHGGNTHEDTDGCPLAGKNKSINKVYNCQEINKSILRMVIQALKAKEDVFITFSGRRNHVS